MRYAIISDVHANLEALTAVLARIDELNVDQTVCLGDLVGYNATPNECIALVRERGIPALCGNHDAVACGREEPWGFNPIAMAAAVWTRETLSEENLEWLRSLPDEQVFDDFLAVHGAPGNRDLYLFSWDDVLPQFDEVERRGISLCFFGHTHSPGIFSRDGVYAVEDDSTFELDRETAYFINPGSVGQPRDGDWRASFGLWDTDTGLYELVRVDYPVKRASERVIEQGLPQFLAERLFLGR